MIIHSSLPDFILFIYVHMSEADHNYDPKEMAIIKQKMSKLFGQEVDFEKKLYQTIREYNSFDKNKLKELFQESFLHFKNDLNEKESVYKDLQEILLADGEMSADEKAALEKLKKMIE